MTRIVLVHGASHGAWCWRDVIPRLQAQGHEVVAIDLPGHGPGEAPQPDVTLPDYQQAVLAEVSPKTVLVGHSLGGLSISLAAAANPDDVAALIYVAAVIPSPGQSFIEVRKDAISPAVDATTIRDGSLSRLDLETFADVFCSECSEQDRAFATKNVSAQPISVMFETLNYEQIDVPRHYVCCLKDCVVLPSYQRRLTQDWPQDTVHDLDTGHSPFFSDPDGLAHHLNAIASGNE